MTSLTLSALLRWLRGMPGAFRAQPVGFPGGEVRVRAVLADLWDEVTGQPAPPALLAAFEAQSDGKTERNRLRLLLAAAHVLWHPTLRASRPQPERLRRLLIQELPAMAAVVPADSLLDDEERGEELIRRALRAAGLHLEGETTHDAEDRLKQVDSVERHRVLAEAAQRERRAREVREAMARKAAEEAAAKVTRE